MATKRKSPSIKIVTPKGRLSFPALFEPVSFEGQPPKYTAVLLLDKKDPEVVKFKANLLAACKKIAEAMWPDPAERMKFGAYNLPIQDGDKPTAKERQRPDGYAGMWVVTARSNAKFKPGIVDNQMQSIIDESEIYGGCYALISFNVFGYDRMGNQGISAGLLNVMKVGDGEHFGGDRSKPEDDFTAMDDAELAAVAAERTETDDMWN